MGATSFPGSFVTPSLTAAKCNAWFAFPNKFLQWEKSPTDLRSLEELVALLDATYIFFCVFDISARSWFCDTTKMCYIFRQICPFHSELRKDKIATCLPLPPAFFLSPPTFWEARDQPEPGSFFPRMKDPGNEVGMGAEKRDPKEFTTAKFNIPCNFFIEVSKSREPFSMSLWKGNVNKTDMTVIHRRKNLWNK